MGAMRMRLRAKLRARWRVWSAIALAAGPGLIAAGLRPAAVLRSK